MAILPTVVELRRCLGVGGDHGELPGLPGMRYLPGPGSTVVPLTDTVAGAAWAPCRDGVFSRDEMEWAARLVFPRFGKAWVGTYVLLREVPGRVTLTPMVYVWIRTGGPGEPSVDGVEFSLSHTGPVVLIGLGDLPLGVDVERVPGRWAVQQVGSSFHPREAAELFGLPVDERFEVFARVWVRKEALFKATGTGLSRGIPRDYVGTGMIPGTPVLGLRIHDAALPGLSGHRAVLRTTAAVTVP